LLCASAGAANASVKPAIRQRFWIFMVHSFSMPRFAGVEESLPLL
jgi:hypothetical protein